ncbi:hypothetical protein ACW9H7_09880 [Pseudomonas yamanorum]
MQTENDVSLENTRVTTTSWIQPASPPSQKTEDAHFFEAKVEHSTLPVNTAASRNISNILTEASALLVKSTNRMSKTLTAFNTTHNEKEKLKYSTELSNTVLLNHAATKSIGKAIQLVEKVGNLQ